MTGEATLAPCPFITCTSWLYFVCTPSLTARVSPGSDEVALMSLVHINVNGTTSLLETASSVPSFSPNPGNYQR